MESLFVCLQPLLECSASASAVVLKYLLLVVSFVGTARLFFKPLQPVLLALADLGPLKKVDWDNKVIGYVGFVLDYVFSIKLPK